MQSEVQKYVERKLSGLIGTGDAGFVSAIRRDMKQKFGLICSVIYVGWSPDHNSDVTCIKITVDDSNYAAYKNLITGEMS